jgi:hypothetical protein
MSALPRRADVARRGRAGFTVLETVLALALFAVVTTSALYAARGGMGAFRATRGVSDAEARVRRAIERVAIELMSAGASELAENTGDLDGPLGSHDFDYAKPQSWPLPALNLAVAENAPGYGLPLFGPVHRLAFEYAPGETNDGTDEDGNGLVDDGVLVLVRDIDGDEHRSVLCRGVREMLEGEVPDGDDDNGNGVVDEAGFNVRRDGDVLVVRLSVEESSESGIVVRTLETSVRLRN